MKTLIFHITGMHCASCERLTEAELRDGPGVVAVKASLVRESVEITGDFGGQSDEAVMSELGRLVRKHGFSLSLTRTKNAVKWPEFIVAAPVALGLMAVFLFAQKLGVGRLVDSTRMGYGVAFLIGIVASLSSCMAIVGGLVLSLSAHYAQKGEKTRPQILFHAGRLISFFVLGGVAGAAGSIFRFGPFGSMILGLVVGGVMIVMGVSLLDILPSAKKLQLRLPQTVGKRIHALQNRRVGIMPFALGAATFFLPCGFTQSMQLYTLTTGNFLTGALTMFGFALGTFPVLALLSFSALGARQHPAMFFKAAGLLVVLFGVYDILNSLAGYGLIQPIFNF